MDPVINRINQCEPADFMQLLGGIYEHSPWVAEQTLGARPFADLEGLHDHMKTIVASAAQEQKLALLNAHPELAGREAEAGELTEDSSKEQRRAGLDQCSPQELATIQLCNREYREKFGFPFIIAVSGLNRQQVIDAMQRRLQQGAAEEFATALAEVDKIAWIRLQAL